MIVLIKKGYPFVPYTMNSYTPEESIRRSKEFYEWANKRRSIREFSNKTFPKEIITNILRTANTSPSGGHKQPWTFVVVDDPNLKHQIRISAEIEEKESYEHRMSSEWLEDLAPLGTDWHKPYLEVAPYLMVVFKQEYGLDAVTGKHSKHYYVNESVGIAVGMLLLAIFNAGLATLTHTPNPMNFLREILKRPKNEKAYVLMPVGYPADSVFVPDLKRKSLEQYVQWNTV